MRPPARSRRPLSCSASGSAQGDNALFLFVRVGRLLNGGELPVSQPFVGMLGPDLPCVLLPVDVEVHADWFVGVADHRWKPYLVLD